MSYLKLLVSNRTENDMGISKVLSAYRSCKDLDQKVTCIMWAKRVFSGLEIERLLFTLLRIDKELDLVIAHYRKVMYDHV